MRWNIFISNKFKKYINKYIRVCEVNILSLFYGLIKKINSFILFLHLIEVWYSLERKKMVLYQVYSHEIKKRYKSNIFSKASIVQFICVVLSLLGPFLIAYYMTGLYFCSFSLAVIHYYCFFNGLISIFWRFLDKTKTICRTTEREFSI